MVKKTILGLFMASQMAFASANDVSKDSLMIFMSSSLGTKTLASYAEEAKDYNATGLFKGIRKSDKTLMEFLREVINPIKEVSGAIKMPITIDPKAFEKFGIQSVPTLVFYDAETNQYYKTVGSTTISYAKQAIEEQYHIKLNLDRDDAASNLLQQKRFDPTKSKGFESIFGSGKPDFQFFKYAN